MRTLSSVMLAFALLSVAAPARGDEPFFSAPLRGNVANQSIAGFPSSRVTWDITRGRVTLVPFGKGEAVVVVRTRGLIIPAFGTNPSPDLLARLVCHDAVGTPAEAARTKAVRFPESGNATLVDVVRVPDDCFAPIVLLTGSRDPEGNQPGNWFAVSGF